ncbi:MAG: DsrE family protein [Chloroflexi bacterium]|nr:DsrE family protein [Chloroflexota bacterium]
MAEEIATNPNKKFTVLLTVGLNSPGVARAALMFATIAAVSDLQTVVYCVQEGADLMVKGVVDREETKPGMPTLRQRLDEAIAAGVEFQVCEATAVGRGITREDLIEQARIVGGAVLIANTLESAGVLSF